MHNFLGRSVYLTTFEKQSASLAAHAAGGAPVFLSLHISEEFSTTYVHRCTEICHWLAEKGWSILADVSRSTVEQFQQPDLASLAQALHLWGLRIDDGFTTKEICALAEKMPVAVNASTILPEEAAKIAACGSKVMAMHNFYPRPETGLDEAFLKESTDRLHQVGLQVLGFIPGDEDLRGPIYSGLPTLEAHRGIAPSAAFVDMAERFGLEEIFAGDPGVSAFEQSIIQTWCSTGETMIPCTLEPLYESLYDVTFTCRPDTPAALIRFQESRQYAAQGKPVKPGHTEARPRGAITIDNERYGRYSGEIQLLRTALPADERVNVIGTVSPKHLLLVDRLTHGGKFRLVRTPTDRGEETKGLP